MGDGAHFWRNVGIIGGAHVALLIAFVRWGGAHKIEPSQQVVWLSGNTPAEANAASHAMPTPTPEPVETAEPEEQPTIPPVKSEIQLPVQTPTPAQTPRPVVKLSPIPVAKPAPTPKPAAKPTARKVIAKATPKPKAKSSAPPPESDEDDDSNAARDAIGKTPGAQAGGGGSGAGGNSARAETQWYGRMLHDRFHNAWDQPTTVVASGTKMSALVRVRIEKNGHVSRFEIVKPTGNVVVDESVRAVASKVTQLDPLPSGVGGEHYDVTINFELNPEE